MSPPKSGFEKGDWNFKKPGFAGLWGGIAYNTFLETITQEAPGARTPPQHAQVFGSS